MTPQDLYDLRWVMDSRLSPDGTSVAYVVCEIDRETNDYVSSIWLEPTAGAGPATQLTFGPKRDIGPRWSPDGSQLAFLSNRADEDEQLYVVDPRGGEPRKLTNFEEEVADIVWAPDGSALAFCSRVRDAAYAESDERLRGPRRFRRLQFKLDNVGWTGDRRQHVFTVAADGSAPPVQLTDGDYEDASPTWSPDGARIAFISNRDDDWDLTTATEVYVVEADGGDPKPVTTEGGIAELPSWSPDGATIAFQLTPDAMDEPRHARIAVVDTTGWRVKTLTEELDRNCGPYPPLREPQWTAEGNVLFALEDYGNTHLYEVSPRDAKPRRVVGGDLSVTGWDCAAGTLVYLASTPTSLPELFVGERKATAVQSSFASGRELSPAERFTAVSPDGAEVDAWIMRPAGYTEGRRYPVLLNIHGGPFAQYGHRFLDEFQIQAGAGYVVVYSNPRGSSGYSEEWGRAIRGPGAAGPGMGTVDYHDVMAVLDTALDRFDFCDPDRLGVLGGSYGGYLTSWIVSHSNRFKAACSERAVNDWASMWGSSDFGWTFKGHVGSFLFEDPEPWRAMSPVNYAAAIETPLLIMHSENDLRCNVEQAEQLFTTLRLLRRDVELVRWPAESHELSRSGSPAHRVARGEIILEFFDRYLK